MKRPKRDDFKRELYDGADMAEWFQDYYKALEKYADYLEAKAGQHETVVNRLEKLLPKLEDGKATHMEWRDCAQKYRDENPDIGSKEFHAECVEEYNERIGAIKAAIEALK